MTPFFMAWMMFLALPCPSKKWDDNKKTEMLAAYPFIGLIVGGIWLGIYKLCAVLHLQFVGLALTAVLPWLLTGFMHIDARRVLCRHLHCGAEHLYPCGMAADTVHGKALGAAVHTGGGKSSNICLRAQLRAA